MKHSYPEILEIDGMAYPVEYEVALKATSTVRVKNGVVKMKLSRYSFGKAREETIERFLEWAKKRLLKEAKAKSTMLLPEYCDGGLVYTHNKVYEIRVLFMPVQNVRSKLVEEGVIKVVFPENYRRLDLKNALKDAVERVIIKDQLPYLKEVLDELNLLHFQAHYKDVRFKRVNGRFGSCSSKGNINIAYRLLFAPKEVFVYVCVHELAHLKQFNHSARFWALVEEAMPGYKDQEKWLRDNGFALG